MSPVAGIETIDDYSDKRSAINLVHRFPLALRSIVRRSIVWFVVGGLLFALVLRTMALPDQENVSAIVNDTIFNLSLGLAVVIALTLLGKVIYEFLYHSLYYYGLEQGHIVVSEGVFLKERSSIPVTEVSDIVLTRGVLDFFFGLYNLYISTPSPDSHQIGEIRGLSTATAAALQDYLQIALQATHPETTDIKPFLQRNREANQSSFKAVG